MQPIIKAFFHDNSSTLSYVVYCPETLHCCVIDPALDYDIFSGDISTLPLNEITEYMTQHKLINQWILDTHAHADHVTGSAVLKSKVGGSIACSVNITNVQNSMTRLLNLPQDLLTTEGFDYLLEDGQTLSLGKLTIEVLATPGHTPDSISYIIGDNAFIGDTLFMPDSGSARCDFPKGSAKLLYDSIQKIYALGDDVNLHIGHDYQPNGRELRYVCDVLEQKENNVHINQGVSKSEYVSQRMSRDAALAIPRLLYPALQINIRAGQLPHNEENQQAYIKFPVQFK